MSKGKRLVLALVLLVTFCTVAIAASPKVDSILQEHDVLVPFFLPRTLFTITPQGDDVTWSISRKNGDEWEDATVSWDQSTPLQGEIGAEDGQQRIWWNFKNYGDNTGHDGGVTHRLDVKVNGKTVSPQGYYIVNGTQYGNNYFKLRDIAYLLSGTKGQFNVRWDKENERILLTSGTAYETVGGELADSSTAVEKIGKSTSTIVLDGEEITLDGYIINGNNYYKLRDIGKAIGFDVDFDNASSTVLVKTTSDYSGDDEDTNSGNSGNTGSNTTPTVTNPTSYTFSGSGWGHSVGMSQWGAYAMAQKGFTYDQILKFYFTGIEIAE